MGGFLNLSFLPEPSLFLILTNITVPVDFVDSGIIFGCLLDSLNQSAIVFSTNRTLFDGAL